jgi:hypothetical protein
MPKATSARLRFSAQAFGRPRRLQITTGGTVVDVVPVDVQRADYDTAAFSVPEGLSFLDLVSLNGAESPGPDPRRLSIALFGLQVAVQGSAADGTTVRR